MIEPITTVNPATGITIAAHPALTTDQIEDCLANTHATARHWAATPLSDRLAALRSLATALRADKDTYASMITREMGKPIAEATAEIEKCAVTADYYADHAGHMLADEPVNMGGSETRAWVAYEPAGVVLAVMPWNFPFWQVMRFAVPTLAAGNGVVLKHSPNVTGCALAIEELLRRSGFPEGLLTALVVAEPEVPATIEHLVGDDRIAAVTLTGSNRAGAAVGAAAGRRVKKAVLELGGSDPFIVLDDADLDAATTAAVKARFTNCGQSCVCAKRLLVADSVADQFTRLFVDKTRDLVVGDPNDPTTQVGPLARADLRIQVDDQVVRSVAQGARLLTGGQSIDKPGYFYEPTVLSEVRPGMAVFDEETFGPVAAISSAATDADLAQLADTSPYGLGLSVWTADPQRAVALARRITSGAVFVNAIVASDPRLPFGGTKHSGYGRELATAGLREFTTIRSYWVQQ
ncbi:aldehyde dehydrogenase family protein [Nocardia sp. CA-120079]|uniref:aldehyde dehydrogenase family protein n=1 Tax=Nocardia sp. CA-120079 TaxID=3239974 RepID=UPI003D95FC2F